MLPKSLWPNMANVQIQSPGQLEGATTCSNSIMSFMTAVSSAREQAAVLSMNDRKNNSTVLTKTEEPAAGVVQVRVSKPCIKSPILLPSTNVPG